VLEAGDVAHALHIVLAQRAPDELAVEDAGLDEGPVAGHERRAPAAEVVQHHRGQTRGCQGAPDLRSDVAGAGGGTHAPWTPSGALVRSVHSVRRVRIP